jgi:hypothetical protein
MAVKSEYHYPDGAPECVLLDSGEYAHFADKGATLVRVLSFMASPPPNAPERCQLPSPSA